jgi:hypothetical protein
LGKLRKLHWDNLIPQKRCTCDHTTSVKFLPAKLLRDISCWPGLHAAIFLQCWSGYIREWNSSVEQRYDDDLKVGVAGCGSISVCLDGSGGGAVEQ